MSAVGTTRTWASAPHMSAFGCKAQTPASRAPYLAGDGKGAKAAPFAALHLVANGTKRTSNGDCRMSAFGGKADIVVQEPNVR